jgi:hypothetical protein
VPNFANLIDSLEKLAFEVLMWIIFIPKTLTKVFINPSWVSTYVKDELKKERGNRFQAYISPVFLLVVSSVIPVAINLIIPEPSVEIVGPYEGVVGEEYYFSPGELVSRWPSMQPIEYRYEVWLWEEDNWTLQISEEWSSEDSHFLAYTWQEPGEYSVGLYIRNGMGEEVSKYDCILIYGNEDEFFNLAGSYDGDTCSGSFISSETYSQKETPQSPFRRLGQELQGETVLIAGLIFLAFPLLFSLIIELFLKKRSLDRQNLRQMFYIQCLYFSPLYFGLSVIIMTEPFFFSSDSTELSWNLSEQLFFFSFLWFLLIIGWFLYNEAREIISEFTTNGYSKRRGVGVFLLCLIISVFVGFIGLLLVDEADASKLLVWRMYNWGFGLLLLIGAYRFVRRIIFRRGAEEAEKPETQEPTTA